MVLLNHYLDPGNEHRVCFHLFRVFHGDGSYTAASRFGNFLRQDSSLVSMYRRITRSDSVVFFGIPLFERKGLGRGERGYEEGVISKLISAIFADDKPLCEEYRQACSISPFYCLCRIQLAGISIDVVYRRGKLARAFRTRDPLSNAFDRLGIPTMSLFYLPGENKVCRGIIETPVKPYSECVSLSLSEDRYKLLLQRDRGRDDTLRFAVFARNVRQPQER